MKWTSLVARGVGVSISCWPLATSAGSVNLYVGLEKCKTCHEKELYGDQVSAWHGNVHAAAYTSLLSAKGIEAARRAGIEGSPQEASECRECHVTAYGVPATSIKYEIDPTNGVACEACHGPGEEYRKKSIMSDPDEAASHGLVPQQEEVCAACHNQRSPFWDPERYTREDGSRTSFDYDQAIRRIQHPIPDEVRGKIMEIEEAEEAEKNKKKKKKKRRVGR